MELFLVILIGAFLYLTPGALLLAVLRPRGLRSWEWVVLALVASLVIVPFYFSVLSLFFALRLTVLWLIPLGMALLVAAILRARAGAQPGFALRDRHHGTVGRTEGLLAIWWVIIFSVVICLPRMNFFWMGNAATWGGSGDEYWHLSELVAVAFSGLPPHHYFFPDLSLAYYYWSYIPPALLVNLDALAFSPARVLALHSFFTVFAFAGLAAIVLQRTFASRIARWVGLWSLTIAGGFDFFVTMNLAKYEDWQQQAPWLVSLNQVSSFPTLYMWVTQHVSGALIFLIGILVWRNLRASLRTRAFIVGVAAAYGLGTSAFVFLSCAIAGGIWALRYRRLWWSRKAILPLLILLGTFLLGAGGQLRMSLGQTGGMAINTIRVPVLEGFLGSSDNRTLIGLDRWLTLLGFPISAFWILLVEMGLPFMLYAVWLFRDGLQNRRPWHGFLVAYPVLYIFLTLLFTHTGPGHNFVTRGMIPVQIAIILGGCLLLENIRWSAGSRLARSAVLYSLAAALLAQTLTPLFDWRSRTMIALSRTLNPKTPVQLFGVTVASPIQLVPARFQYVTWINAHTPADALIVEYGPVEDDTAFRLLQRLRLVPPDVVSGLSLQGTDLEEVNPAAWEQYRQMASEKDPLTLALASSFVRARQLPVYVVLRDPAQTAPGAEVYRDASVRIVRADLPASHP
jgi:hypothetical protein